MDISLNNLSKRYRFEWIIRNLTHTFNQGSKYAIAGPNGSGKSTLLKILSGHLSPTKGSIEFKKEGSVLEIDEVFQYVAIAAPYVDLIDEFSLREMVQFHSKFKHLKDGHNTDSIIDLISLQDSADKQLKYFSSGMNQRLKLALSFCSSSSLLLLDEPTTNLDAAGVEWYERLFTEYTEGRTVIVASNVERDFLNCEHKLNIMDYKKKTRMVG